MHGLCDIAASWVGVLSLTITQVFVVFVLLLVHISDEETQMKPVVRVVA